MNLYRRLTIVAFGVVLFSASAQGAAGLSAEQAGARLERGRALCREGKLSSAVRVFEEILRNDPTALEAALDRAATLRELGRIPEAIAALRQAQSLSPKDPDIQIQLSWLRFFSGADGKAAESFERIVENDPARVSAALGAGAAFLAGGRALQALPYLERVTAEQPTFAGGYYLQGRALLRLRRDGQAVSVLQTAVQKDWMFVESRRALAETFERQGDMEEAWAHYGRSLNIDPRHPHALARHRALGLRLRRAPAEILPRVRQEFRPEGPTPIENPDNIPIIKIGIATTNVGRPANWPAAVFRFSGDFAVVGLRSQKIFAEGKAGEQWMARMDGPNHMVLIGPDGTRYGRFRAGIECRPLNPHRASFVLEGKAADTSQTGSDDRLYAGGLLLYPGRRGLTLVNAVNVETYLLGVVPSEIPARWPEEILRVQAVLARTQTILRARGFRPHRRHPYDLCDSQHCQVYKGMPAEEERTRRAVLSTRGQMVFYKKGLANTLYHSSCGGFVQASEDLPRWYPVAYLSRVGDGPRGEVWLPDSPWRALVWLDKQPKAYCNAPALSPISDFRWLRIIPARDLERSFARRYGIGRLKRILVVRRTATGHVREMWLVGSRQTRKIMRENEIRNAFNSLRSTLFVVRAKRDAQGHPLEYWIFGGGWGHGVGLCQTGAARQAELGKTYGEICQFYFPRTTLQTRW